MGEVKLTQKFIISVIMITLFTMFCFESAYSKLMYDDYKNIYEEFIIMERKVDRLTEENIQLREYILNKEKD